MEEQNQQTQTREKKIARVSIVGVIANTFLGVIKIIIGFLTGSMAIITDAVNNLTDTGSSIITIVGTHLAGRRPDEKHPFGFGRVEYLTSLVIGLIVFFTGVELCRDSIHTIIHPKPVTITVAALVILAITVVVKIYLGQYTLGAGKKLNSGALVASGLDARSDAVATGATLVSALLNYFAHITIDAWVGAILSLYIAWTGYTILRDTVSKMLGEGVPADFAQQIRKTVMTCPIVLGAYDLILSSYGPNTYTGSINVEVDHRLTAEEIYRQLHELQQKVYEQFHVYIVFGIYAVDKEDPQTKQVVEILKKFRADNPSVLSFHGIFVDEENKEIFCDIVADFKGDHEQLKQALEKILSQGMPQYKPVVTVDSSYVIAAVAKGGNSDKKAHASQPTTPSTAAPTSSTAVPKTEDDKDAKDITSK